MNVHPFEKKLYAGECNHDEIKSWLINRYYFEVTMMRKDCVILTNSTDHSFKQIWLKRVIDSQAIGGGLDQWREMCVSAGINLYDLENPAFEVKCACDNYLEWCKTTNWKTVVAGSLSQIQAALKHTQKCLTWPDFYPGVNWNYFVVRREQAREDSRRCLQFIEYWNLPESEIELASWLKRQLLNAVLN
jgi:pyrroloquinoline-quinone synthase